MFKLIWILNIEDFNVSFKFNVGKYFIKEILKKIKLIKIPNQYTTKKNIEIDAVFSNSEIHDYWVYRTTYSYHFSIMSKIEYVNFS